MTVAVEGFTWAAVATTVRLTDNILALLAWIPHPTPDLAKEFCMAGADITIEATGPQPWGCAVIGASLGIPPSCARRCQYHTKGEQQTYETLVDSSIPSSQAQRPLWAHI